MECLGNFTATKELDAVEFAAHETGSAEEFFIHSCACVETLLEVVEVHNTVDGLEVCVVESALGQAAEERHLTAFEAGSKRTAGTSLLAFMAFAGGFAVARAFAYAEAFAAVFGSFVGF